MLPIKRWFQGVSTHGRDRVSLYEPGARPALCLAVACEGKDEVAQLDKVMRALYPRRVCCCSEPWDRLVHFNNHRRTTRAQINRIMAAYLYAVEWGLN